MNANTLTIHEGKTTLFWEVKVHCGCKTKRTTLVEGLRTQYNFAKLHLGFDRKTPAQATDLVIYEKNRWCTLGKQYNIKHKNVLENL